MWAVTILGCGILSSSVLGQSYPHNRPSAQYRSSQDAAILSDARYLSGDGTFGAAYSQEDGVEFKEESDANGDRKGSYSYVDPNGQRRTVFYTAGKNGFQASGDHIPTARPVVAPKPEYEPLPQYNPPEDYYESEPQYRARNYEPDPSVQYRARYESTQQTRPPPQSHYLQESIYQPAEPEVQSPRYYSRPQQPSYHRPLEPVAVTSRPEYRYSEYRPAEPVAVTSRPEYRYSEYRPIPTTKEPPYSQPRLHSQYQSRAAYPQTARNQRRYSVTNSPDDDSGDYNEITTRIPDPIPRRFYPPGKLDFTRTPDGFSYTFTKN